MGHVRKMQVTIFLTNRCNMRCKYCLTTAHKLPPCSIDLDFVKIGIKDFFDKYKSYWVRFYGPGEPTLEFEKMKIIKQYVDDISPKTPYIELQTNGVFQKNVTEWIAENVDIVYISMDGPPQLNDTYIVGLDNKGKSEIIIKNIKSLVGKCDVAIRATITNINVEIQKELIDFFGDLGIKAIFSKPVLHPVNPQYELPNGIEVDLMTYARNFVEAYSYAKEKGIFYGNIYISNFDEPVLYACRACIPCPHLTTDGYVSACDRAYTGDIRLKDFIYGKYEPTKKRIVYFKDRIEKLRKRIPQNMSACKNCNIANNCAGACLGTAYQYTGDIYGTIPELCDIIKYFAKYIPRNKGLFPYFHP